MLVGLPGAGKSTVGPLVAARLGWRFVDLDGAIAHRAGLPVTEIFATGGEATFRRLEREETATLAGERDLVLAPGGGWMLDPANRQLFRELTLTVYLRISPATAMVRLEREVGSRPLLAGPNPLGSIERLLAVREAAYLQANHQLAVDSMTPSEIADTIVALATGSVPD